MILEVEDIHCFHGLSHILHGVSLQIDAGEIVSLLGRNGAGKTTTIEAIMGLVRSRSGVIRVGTTPVTGRPPHQVCRTGVGWVPQGRRIFGRLTVEENIRLATLKPTAGSRSDGFDRVYSLFPNSTRASQGSCRRFVWWRAANARCCPCANRRSACPASR